ncbi:MAG TPA: hypothetical protein DDX39_06985 [Bacteroidales bacterium]|nr:MAG: hypothetical protein A2W98_14920 [Bacteroidetes bacterium GWF2_33_38]OFY91340.1 MAG: hypothetical protein A2236_13825 [Bacteroidetes bacterium RIFOXYA2_FULL_33_7]HBF88373.1 hypothetical protein [Bacteroidales bacterium]
METINFYHSKKSIMKKVALGLVLVAAGLLFLAINFNYIERDAIKIILTWQMLLITIGFINIFDRNSRTSGIILILVGTFFILPKLFVFPFNFVGLFWPVLLILGGIFIIARIGKKSKFHQHSDFKLDSGYIEITNVFAGGKHVISPVEFKGGKISNVFGGAEIDLTQTTLADGKNVLEVNAVFGGVSLIVPSDWLIHLEISSVLGGFEDKRRLNQHANINQSKELFIKGSAVFGGGEIKSV